MIEGRASRVYWHAEHRKFCVLPMNQRRGEKHESLFFGMGSIVPGCAALKSWAERTERVETHAFRSSKGAPESGDITGILRNGRRLNRPTIFFLSRTRLR